MREDEPLEYRSPQRTSRPPMYSLVLGVLAAAFLLAFGALMGLAVIVTLYECLWDHDQLSKLWGAVVFLPVAVVYLSVGALIMYHNVQMLRGGPLRASRWGRLLQLLNKDMDGNERQHQED